MQNAIDDGSKPLDGKKEDFCLHVFGGDRPIDAYRKCYPKAAQKTCESCSSAWRNEPKIDLRIAWLRSQVAKDKVMSVEYKRAKLFEIVETPIGDVNERHKLCQEYSRTDSAESTTVRYKMPSKMDAIKEDNVMAGHRSPEKVEHSGTVTVSDRLAELRAKKYVKKV